MVKSLFRLFRKPPQQPAPQPVFDAPLRPDRPLALIGDVHGQDPLLERLLDRPELAGRQVVQVGDMIDRGEKSAGVLARLRARDEVIALMGNHELMCLGFLDTPEESGALWLRNGGLQTLASFGVGFAGLRGGQAGAGELRAARDALAAAMGAELIDWIRARPRSWQSGNLLVTHAGADPALPPELQDPTALAWGCRGFERQTRSDGLWVAYGHRIVEEAHARDGRIAVDTGAYATGRLSAALVDEDGSLAFLSA